MSMDPSFGHAKLQQWKWEMGYLDRYNQVHIHTFNIRLPDP